MASTAITTMTRMMESLPESIQLRVIDYLRDYIEDLQDEIKWDSSFKERQPQLITAARRAKREISEGGAKPMDYSRL
jgi:hypothetical protein